MKKFCHHCGKEVIVGAKFCSSCGCNLNSLANTPAPPAAPPKPRSQFEPFAAGGSDDDDDDSYIDKMTHLDIRQDGLQVEITRDRPLGESVGSLVAAAMQSGPLLNPDPARPPQYNDSKVFMEEFRKEAGTRGPANGKE